MRNVSGHSYRENQIVHFMFSNFFFRKSCRLWNNVEKYCGAGKATDTIWRMRVACWVPKATNTLIICNIYYIYTTTVVTRKRLNVPWYIHCLSWFVYMQFSYVEECAYSSAHTLHHFPVKYPRVCWEGMLKLVVAEVLRQSYCCSRQQLQSCLNHGDQNPRLICVYQ